MTQESHLLRIIVSNPDGNLDDDTSRLIYAEWLDEMADDHVNVPGHSSTQEMRDRAEFIRVQISLATGYDLASNDASNRGKPLTPEMVTAFTNRQNELLALHRAEWNATIRQDLPLSCEEVIFHRGFPRDVRVNGIRELVDYGILESDTNTLTGLAVRNLGNQLPALLEYQGIDRLSTLNLRFNGIWVEGAVALAASPHLTRLTELDLGNTGIGDEGAEALAASPHLKNLRSLDLGSDGIGPQGTIALAASPFLTQLTDLNLRSNYVGDEGAEALAASPFLTQLTDLNLMFNGIGEAGAAALAASPYLSLPAKLSGLRTAGYQDTAEDVERASSQRTVLQQIEWFQTNWRGHPGQILYRTPVGGLLPEQVAELREQVIGILVDAGLPRDAVAARVVVRPSREIGQCLTVAGNRACLALAGAVGRGRLPGSSMHEPGSWQNNSRQTAQATGQPTNGRE